MLPRQFCWWSWVCCWRRHQNRKRRFIDCHVGNLALPATCNKVSSTQTDDDDTSYNSKHHPYDDVCCLICATCKQEWEWSKKGIWGRDCKGKLTTCCSRYVLLRWRGCVPVECFNMWMSAGYLCWKYYMLGQGFGLSCIKTNMNVVSQYTIKIYVGTELVFSTRSSREHFGASL